MKVVSYSEACKGEWFLTTTGELRKMVISIEDNGIRSMAMSKWGSDGAQFDLPQYAFHGTLASKHSGCFKVDLPNWSIIQQVAKQEGIVFYITAKRCHPNANKDLVESNQLFVQGIDTPSDYSLVRLVQKKIIEKFNGSERLLLDGMVEKSQSNLYRVTIGFSCTRKMANQLKRLFPNYNVSQRKEAFDTFTNKSCSLMSEEELKTWMFAPQTYQEYLALPSPKAFEYKQSEPIHKNIEPIQIKHSYNILPLSQQKELKEDVNSIAKQFVEACKEFDIKGNIKFVDKIIGTALIDLIFKVDGVKYSSIVKLQEDFQMKLGQNLEIVQGKQANTISVSIQRKERAIITLGDALRNNKLDIKDMQLPIFIGVDKYGKPIIDDFARIAHLLAAGSTGSGKSVWLNSLLTYWCLTLNREELLLYLIDCKMVELPPFEGANIVEKVVTDSEKGIELLGNLVVEMDRRYKLLQEAKCRNIKQYRSKGFKLPNIVCVIDEYADLYLSAKAVEKSVVKIAQKARACGIHILLCTQRPSVDIVSGLLKANLPSRVVFMLKSSSDYRTVCDGSVPFKLLGKGDGFCQLEGKEDFMRFQGCIVAETEEGVDEVIEQITSNKTKYTNNLQQTTNQISDSKVLEFKTPMSKKELVWDFIDRTRDTRLRSILAEIGGDMNSIVEIMKELVEDGLLIAPDGKIKGYRIKEELEV
jgi:hypothetical protein